MAASASPFPLTWNLTGKAASSAANKRGRCSYASRGATSTRIGESEVEPSRSLIVRSAFDGSGLPVSAVRRTVAHRDRSRLEAPRELRHGDRCETHQGRERVLELRSQTQGPR